MRLVTRYDKVRGWMTQHVIGLDAAMLAWLRTPCIEAKTAASKLPASCASLGASRVVKQPMCLNAPELAWLHTRCDEAESAALKQVNQNHARCCRRLVRGVSRQRTTGRHCC